MSSPSEPTDRELLARIQSGDEAAARAVFDRYTERLIALVRARLQRKLARRLDPDDIVLSAWRSFLIRGRDGQWSAEGGDLWPILAVLALRKLSRQVERNAAGRRNLHREQPWNGPDDLAPWILQEPSDEQAIALADELERILEDRDPADREIIYLRLSGLESPEIATTLNRSERTVRRILEVFREGLVPQTASESGFVIGAVDLEIVLRQIRGPSTSGRESPGSIPFELAAGRQIRFADLRLHKLIGQGGVGRVYRATLQSEPRTVAVKFLKKAFWRDQRALHSLASELQAASRIHHPGVLGPTGSGRTPSGVPFLVSEWFEGLTFRDWNRQLRPSLGDVLARTAIAAEALHAAHEVGVVHGDVTPVNLLTSSNGRVVVTDFGFASIAGPHPAAVPGGTAGFLAPEQRSATLGGLGPWTDVYGLGRTLLSMITPDPRCEHDANCAELRDYLRNCTAERPQARPHSMQAVAETLTQLASRLGSAGE